MGKIAGIDNFASNNAILCESITFAPRARQSSKCQNIYHLRGQSSGTNVTKIQKSMKAETEPLKSRKRHGSVTGRCIFEGSKEISLSPLRCIFPGPLLRDVGNVWWIN